MDTSSLIGNGGISSGSSGDNFNLSSLPSYSAPSTPISTSNSGGLFSNFGNTTDTSNQASGNFSISTPPSGLGSTPTTTTPSSSNLIGSVAPASTTVVSNANKIDQVNNQLDTLNNLPARGPTTTDSGQSILPNGQPDNYTSPEIPEGSSPIYGAVNGISNRVVGYNQTDENGVTNPVYLDNTLQTSTEDKQINDMLSAMSAKTDAITAAGISNIQDQYSILQQQQQRINNAAIAGANAYLVGGGQGISSSGDLVAAQMSYGLQQIADLDNKEATAINTAQQSALNQDYKNMEDQLKVVEDTRTTKMGLIQKQVQYLQDKNNTIAANQYQSSKDNAIANVLTSGVTDPKDILATLQKNGNNDVTLDDINKNLQAIADANNAPVSKLSQDVQTFNYLSKIPNGLPSSISSLSDKAQQLAAYLKMVNSSSSSVIAKGIIPGMTQGTTSGAGSGATSIAKIAGVQDPSQSLSDVVSSLGMDKVVAGVIANEGRSPAGVNNNPGNIKFAGLPGQIDSGVKASDGGTFASYATPEAGKQAIADLIQKGADKGFSFQDFFNSYTNTQPNAPGTTGSPTIDATQSGYSTAIVPNSGGLTQAAIDQAAISLALTGNLPTGGRSSTGAGLLQSTAIKAREGELNANGNIQANKATLTANTSALKQQTDYQNSVQRALTASEGGGQWIVNNAPAGINPNDSTFLNTKLNDLTKQFGDSQDIRNYQAALFEIGNEYSQVFARGGQRSVEGNQDAQNIINGNVSMNDLKGILDTLQSIGQINIDASNNQIQTIQKGINNIIGGTPVTADSHNGYQLPTTGGNTSNTYKGYTIEPIQ